ncbi:HNH endonuclease [Antribacter sp. KLBMP9083]|uniref:HNH endonuclease n=1 Tax=Antribacter soli TaxID=2910976 RepID=A0AA41QID2_9MICO|nr:HNH endonuclease signature motif containing protein [Antribacter soli]MCF4123727.1 HNH endonuclease [Antribacter soli]
MATRQGVVVMVLAMTPGDGRALDGCAQDGTPDGLAPDGFDAVLAAAPAGAGLAGLLESIASIGPEGVQGVKSLGDGDLLDLAAGWARLIGWATAQQAAVAGELGRRRAWSVEHAHAAVELGARLGVPGPEADRVMARGAGLDRHREVAAALVSASIDTVKADLLLTAGKTLTLEQRQAAIADVLPLAPGQSRRWVRDKMNEHARRHQTPAEQTTSEQDARAVYLDQVDGGTMAWLSAHLPATDAAAVWATLDTAGRAIRRAGKDRTLAQARADALTAILTGRLIVPTVPRCAPQETPPPTGAAGTAASTTAETSADGPATVPGYVPGVPRTTAPAPATSGCPSPGSTADADADACSGAGAGSTTDAGSTTEAGCLCGGCLCGATRITVLPVRAQVRVTVAASTLAGRDDEPGFLDGYGPVEADTAALLATDGTWQRLVTDPVTGILTDHSTHAYVPGVVLRQAVVERDVTCQFPQCDRPARAADLDHITRFDHALDPATLPKDTPGQTRAANLQALCRRHHNAKTHHGWTAIRDPHTGVTVWTAPTGHTYQRPPTQAGRPVSLRDHDRRLLGRPTAGTQRTADPGPRPSPAPGQAQGPGPGPDPGPGSLSRLEPGDPPF